MSFLESLQAKRSELRRNCETIVTTATGERYVEDTKTQERIKLDEGKSYGFVLDTKPDLIPACILPDFLFLGSQDSVSLENIEKYQLTHILSIGVECPLKDLPVGIQNVYLACLDLPEVSLCGNIFKKSFKFIELARSSGGRILVHCNAGVSRSSSVVIAYLMRFHDMDFEEAYKHVKARRECIRPNSGFLRQLKKFKR